MAIKELLTETESTWLFVLRDYGYELTVRKSTNGNYALFDVAHASTGQIANGLRSTQLATIAHATMVGIQLGRTRATSLVNPPAPPAIKYID